MDSVELNLVPNYLTAPTREALRESMLLNNIRLVSFVKYQDISELKDGSFICWYYEKIKFEVPEKEIK
jgi:hypothetical protein